MGDSKGNKRCPSQCPPSAQANPRRIVTGPEPVSFQRVASALSESLGRPVQYRPVGVLRYLRHLRSRNLPWGQAIVQTVLHLGLRFGNAKGVDPTLERLLGRKPRTIRDYIDDHIELWSPG